MSKRLTCLLAVGALVLPLPAYADCAERIAAVENHPAISEKSASVDDAERPENPTQGNEERIVEEEVVENGETIREDGGETTHADGGPAAPAENWFEDINDKAVVLTHLEAAKEAKQAGDENACLEAVEEAEATFKSDAG
ncbi:MAG: hypothetical protein ACFCUT_08375 [Kiloniellaceae bacterium]